MDTPETITHLSLCSGYGGIDLGLKRVLPTLRTIAYVEIEAFAVANLVAKMEEGRLDAAPVWTNLKTCDWSIFRDRVDILSGGYPCQPFSACGTRRGKEDPRHLWPFIQGAVAIIRPRYCFFENVEGHITLGLKDVLHDLGELGYEYSAGLFSAAECGASHQRKRVFILAHSRREHREVSPGWELSAEQIAGGNGEARRAWPGRPGEYQHEWEEPRVVGNAHSHESPSQRGDDAEVPQLQKGQRSEQCASLSGGAGAELGDSSCLQPERGGDVSELGGAEGAEHSQTQQQQRDGNAPVGSSETTELAKSDAQRCDRRQDNQGEQAAGRDGAEAASRRKVEPIVGGATDGTASGVDATANRVDRLRLLGNGVVPDTAAKAFMTLWKELDKE